jgi:hypothetical protein
MNIDYYSKYIKYKHKYLDYLSLKNNDISKKEATITGGGNKILTYLILDNQGLYHDRLREILNNIGFIEVNKQQVLSSPDKFVDFFWMGQSNEEGNRFDKDLYQIKSTLKTLLWRDKTHTMGKDTITNKQQLYLNMKKYFPDICSKHMAQTFLLKNIQSLEQIKSVMTSDTPKVPLVDKIISDLETISSDIDKITLSDTPKVPLVYETTSSDTTKVPLAYETTSSDTPKVRLVYETTSSDTYETISDTPKIPLVYKTTKSVYIVKPVGQGACAGVGVTVVTNDRELEDARKELSKRFKNVIISEYIQNPLLYEGRKFHLRMYILINSEPFSWSFWDQGKAMTAKLKYKNSDWTNKLIHDSHGETTPEDIYFPEDILPKGKYDYVYKQMKTILGAVSEIIKPNVKCYEESKYCCEIFGIDFMITDDYTVKLIEINAEAGYGSKNEDKTKYKKYCSEYFDWFYKESLLFKLFYKSSKKLSRNIK